MIKQLVMPVLTGKGPNFSKLTAKGCGIGDYRLRYKLPGNVLRMTQNQEPEVTQVNLVSDFFDPYTEKHFNRTFVHAGFEWWAYRGFYLQGYFGKLCQLNMHVEVNRAEPPTSIREGDLDSLEAYLKKDYWDYYEAEQNKDGEAGFNWKKRYDFEHPEELRANGYVPLDSLELVRFPEVYNRETINDVEWLHYGFRGEGMPSHWQTYYWAYPLTEDYYLTISFRAVSEYGNLDMRYQRMLQDAKRIMSMVELHRG